MTSHPPDVILLVCVFATVAPSHSALSLSLIRCVSAELLCIHQWLNLTFVSTSDLTHWWRQHAVAESRSHTFCWIVSMVYFKDAHERCQRNMFIVYSISISASERMCLCQVHKLLSLSKNIQACPSEWNHCSGSIVFTIKCFIFILHNTEAHLS